jgi:hypothetical protein
MLRTTFRPPSLLALLAAVTIGLVCAMPARAGIGAAALADCDAHATLTHHYTIPELRNALATMPASIQTYTNCEQVITQALNQALANGKNNGTAGGSGGSFLPTPVVVVLVLLLLAAATFGALAIRRRREA